MRRDEPILPFLIKLDYIILTALLYYISLFFHYESILFLFLFFRLRSGISEFFFLQNG